MTDASLSTETQALPGPWASDDSGVWAEDPPDGGDIICNPPDTDCEASLARWPSHRRLIAAAPDLLKLAKQFAADCSRCLGLGRYEADGDFSRVATEDCTKCADIRAVIARAEGRS